MAPSGCTIRNATATGAVGVLGAHADWLGGASAYQQYSLKGANLWDFLHRRRRMRSDRRALQRGRDPVRGGQECERRSVDGPGSCVQPSGPGDGRRGPKFGASPAELTGTAIFDRRHGVRSPLAAWTGLGLGRDAVGRKPDQEEERDLGAALPAEVENVLAFSSPSFERRRTLHLRTPARWV
jgi:hypothetical protein